MRAIYVERLGGPEVIAVKDLPEPPAGAGVVRVRVEAAGVSFADLLMRAGAHPERPRPPFVLGWDFVGRVEASADRDWPPGTRVAGLCVLGGQSEAVIAPSRSLVRVPEAVDAAEAVCLVMDFVVAYQMLHRLAHVEAGTSVLVHGAAGGVGSALLQLARLAGARVLGTGRADQLAVIRASGATAVDFERDDVAAAAWRELGGADIVLDGVGGANLRLSMRAVRSGGRVVFYGLTGALHDGAANGWRTARTWLASMFAVACGVTLRGARFQLYSIQRLMRRHLDWYRQDLTLLLDLLACGQVAPHVAARVPLERVREVHERLARGERGKFVVLPGPGAPRGDAAGPRPTAADADA